MNAPLLPPGAERIRRLHELIIDVDEAVADLAHALPQVNDPDLRPRIVAFTEGARATLDAERESPGPEAADRLRIRKRRTSRTLDVRIKGVRRGKLTFKIVAKRVDGRTRVTATSRQSKR